MNNETNTTETRRFAQFIERASIAFEVLRGITDTLVTLKIKREGFEPTDDEVDVMISLWWLSSCKEDLEVASYALSMLETFADKGRDPEDSPEDPEEERLWKVFCGVVELLARVARQNEYARSREPGRSSLTAVRYNRYE